jgi:signal transduction histidine kinase
MTAMESEPLTPALSRTRTMMLVFGMGAATGLHLGLMHLVLWRSWAALLTFFVGSLIYSACTYVLWRYILPWLPGPHGSKRLALEVLVTLATFALLSLAVVAGGAMALGVGGVLSHPAGPQMTVTITPESRQRIAYLYTVVPVLPTTIITLIAYHLVVRRMQALQTRARELTELAATAQLAALRAQLNPHFLFNSLNSIAQLIHADPDKAEVCVERLAELLRYVLRRAEKDFVPLAEELDVTGAYLDIERARFDERLRVETDVDQASLAMLVPNFILQPLVENAVKHGLARKVGPGRVRIEARMAQGGLLLSVHDDGVGMSDTTLGQIYERGVGLRNLRDRLERLYGPAHAPAIVSRLGQGTRVEIRLPPSLPRAA